MKLLAIRALPLSWVEENRGWAESQTCGKRASSVSWSLTGSGGSYEEMNVPERQFGAFPEQGSSAGTRHWAVLGQPSAALTLGWELGSKLPRDQTETVVNTPDKLVLQLNVINYMWIICLKLTVFTSKVLGLGALIHIIIFHLQFFFPRD